MNRNEIVTKLMSEGFSSNTLVSMNDKQLNMLAERILSEEFKVSSKNTEALSSPAIVDAIKDPNKTVEVTEDKGKFPNFLKKGKKGVKPDFNKKKETKKNDEDKVTIMKKVSSKKEINPNLKENEVKSWVMKLVEEAYHPIATKGEIMNLIQLKLNEQYSSSEAKNTQTVTNGQGIDKEAALARIKSANDAKLKFSGRFPGKKYDTGKEQFSKTPNGEYKVITPLSLKQDKPKPTTTTTAQANEQSFAPKATTNPKLPHPKKGHNGIPEFMTYDAIKGSEKSSPTITPKVRPGDPTIKPDNKPKPKHPYKIGPGLDPKPKAISEEKKD
jgi:hypothetical protein